MHEIIGLEGRTIILPASFYRSNVIDITGNLQVIQVYSSFVGSFDMKIANQNNNLFTTIIIDYPEADNIGTVANICIPMITRFDRLMFTFRDMVCNIMRLDGEFELHRLLRAVLKQMEVKFASTWNEREAIIQKHGYDMIAGTTMYSENLIGIKLNTPVRRVAKPFFIGFAILDMSKHIIYDFYYNVLKNIFDNVELLG